MKIMEKLKKFLDELEETLSYSKEITITSEEYGDLLHKITLCKANILFTDTIKVLAKWEIQELERNTNGEYEIYISF